MIFRNLVKMIFSFKEMKILRLHNRIEYRLNGILHREDGPALEYFNGDKYYFVDGILHREDGPAVFLDNENKELIKLGIVSPDDEFSYGIREYYFKGSLHREDGPAIEYSDGEKRYCINGGLHRDDGPAVIKGNHAEFWINGKKISETDEYYVPIKSARN